MRIARNLTLLALAAITATAFMARSASATQDLEVYDEKKTGTRAQEHCGNSLTDNSACEVHMFGVLELRVDLGIFGEAHEMTCNLEIELHLTETAEGRVETVNNTPGDANCPTGMPACNLPWPLHGEEDGPVGVVQSDATVCIDPAEGPVCSGNLAFDIVNNAGHYEAVFNNKSVGLCELDADLEVEFQNSAHAQIMVMHP